MGGTGVRTWLLVGGGLGVVAALFVILLSGTALAVLLESVVALGAGLLTAYLASQAPVPAPAGAPVAPSRGNLTRAGALSGATVGVLAGIGLLVVALQVVYTPEFQDTIAQSLEQQGLQAG